MAAPSERLEYLRTRIEQESITYGEVAELERLREHIEPGDVLLLEWAGVPELAPYLFLLACAPNPSTY